MRHGRHDRDPAFRERKHACLGESVNTRADEAAAYFATIPSLTIFSRTVDEASQFEAAIARDPDDDDAYLVYGDWLQLRGDPRGELIALQYRGHEDAAKDLLSRHAEHFYGALCARPGLLDVTWHLGFLRSCRFSLDDDRGPNHEKRAVAALEELLALRSTRFIRDLSIGVMNVPFNSYQDAIEVIGWRAESVR